MLAGNLCGLFGAGGHVEAQHRPHVIFVDDTIVLRRGLEYQLPAFVHLGGGGLRYQPAVAESAGTTLGGLASSANPDGRRGFLDGLGHYGDVFEGEEPAAVGDSLLLPQAADYPNGFVGPSTAPRLGDTAGLIFHGVFLSESHGGKDPALREVVKGGKLFGEQDGIAEGQGEDARAELEGVGVGGDH